MKDNVTCAVHKLNMKRVSTLIPVDGIMIVYAHVGSHAGKKDGYRVTPGSDHTKGRPQKMVGTPEQLFMEG